MSLWLVNHSIKRQEDGVFIWIVGILRRLRTDNCKTVKIEENHKYYNKNAMVLTIIKIV